jgi:phosphocarrier protein HPr
MAVAERTVQIVNELGLHARPAAEFVKTASRFRADIQVARDNMIVNGKSVLGVMTLAAECGSSLVIRAEGDDAEAAVAALERLVRNGFRE